MMVCGGDSLFKGWHFSAALNPSNNLQPPMTPFPVLPSYEEATGTSDMSRLPSYRQSRAPTRNYHPYLRRRESAVTASGTGLERLLNTIFNDERVEIVPPPALVRGPPPVQPLVPTPLPARRAPQAGPPSNEEGSLRNVLDDELLQAHIVEFDRRVRAIRDVVLQEFVAASKCRAARRASSP
ncbi:hypothetical protein HYPSUDRAFT_514636 [Hypholoma sublateritium FD-334 SS-4]|uniref:Uncharacterized protein n=1 Tax=Hypholoma sublateritium (strain FD-334 SS-4) TaxID=945553 RepID=A0A0D2LMT7_HYPSF|nr:hypothetical protein HYPSUDRAFT_514636 [Hypholoma sublateritium FD-334 SS-4]